LFKVYGVMAVSPFERLANFSSLVLLLGVEFVHSVYKQPSSPSMRLKSSCSPFVNKPLGFTVGQCSAFGV